MNITVELVAFMILVIGVITGAWWRVESAVKAAKQESNAIAQLAATKTDILADNLASLRLHVAETYVSKSGLREQTEQIMGAIKDVAGSLAHLNERIDRVIENGPVAAPRRKTTIT